MKMDKESKEKIKLLKKQEKYNEIYLEFGSEAYLKNTPSKIKKAELKKFKKEGRYEDIYNKYGPAEHEKILVKAMYEEIKEAKGPFKAILWNIGKKLKIATAYTALIAATSATTLTGMAISDTEKNIKNNAIEYAADIEQYNNKINKYAKEINAMNLTDVQVFMKVMDDMWGSIKGYKTPELNLSGFYELDLATEEGYGVCRNMASDVAKKLNAINPEYNARVMPVGMGDTYYQIANITRTVLQDNETVSEHEGEENESSPDILSKIFGNHMVTLVDVKEDNLTLVLDPTNPGIGIYKDGDIIMLNPVHDASSNDKIEYEAKEYTSAVIIRGEGMQGVVDTIKDYFSTYEDANLTFEQIEEKYGLEAQNTALDEVREMSKTEQEKFADSLKVGENEKGEPKSISEDSMIQHLRESNEQER
jgi:hypothetical protein